MIAGQSIDSRGQTEVKGTAGGDEGESVYTSKRATTQIHAQNPPSTESFQL